jgi:hypothetical protein
MVGGLLVDVLGPVPRAELLHVLMLPDFNPPPRSAHRELQDADVRELLVDVDDDPYLRTVVVGDAAGAAPRLLSALGAPGARAVR